MVVQLSLGDVDLNVVDVGKDDSILVLHRWVVEWGFVCRIFLGDLDAIYVPFPLVDADVEHVVN